VPDSVGETGSSASTFLELSTSSSELSGDGGINLSIFDGGSVELEAVSILDGVDVFFTTPCTDLSGSAGIHASPFSALHVFSIATSSMGFDSVGSSTFSHLRDLGMGSGKRVASIVVEGVSGLEFDDIGSINSFVGGTDLVSVGVLASDWSLGAFSFSEVFTLSGFGLSEHVDSLIRGGERNAGTVVAHVNGLVEDGESWVVWTGLGSTLTEFLNRDTVFVPGVDQRSSFVTAWSVFEVDSVLVALIVDSLSHSSVVGMELPAVAIMPDVTGDEIGDSLNWSEHCK
jgi:hypothetical protein